MEFWKDDWILRSGSTPPTPQPSSVNYEGFQQNSYRFTLVLSRDEVSLNLLQHKVKPKKSNRCERYAIGNPEVAGPISAEAVVKTPIFAPTLTFFHPRALCSM